MQANIPTLPSGGNPPLGIFALILGVRQLGALWTAEVWLPQRRALHIVLSFYMHLTFITCPGFQSSPAHIPSAIWETWVQSLGWDKPLEKGKAIHSSILAWRIPWTRQSMGLQRVGHDWASFTSLFITYSVDMNLSRLQETWHAAVHGVTKELDMI